MIIIFLDVDGTIAPFQPTAELYKALFLSQNNTRRFLYFLIGLVMILTLKIFWFSPRIVEFQRRLIFSLFSNSNSTSLAQSCEEIAGKVVKYYRENFSNFLAKYLVGEHKIFLLTHCPEPISKFIVNSLGFDGDYSLEVRNYFRDHNRPKNIDKRAIIDDQRMANPGAVIYYFADDLIDLRPLLAADKGILINPSLFDRIVTHIFPKKLFCEVV